MDFDLSEDERMIQEAARDFAEQELAPRAAASDKAEAFVAEQVKLCADLGFLGMSTSEAYGGSELGAVGASLVLMEVNRACPSTGVTLSVHNSLTCESLMRFGTDAQKGRYLPRLASGEWLGAYALSEAGSGSDAGSLVLDAQQQEDGAYVLRGSKLWISHGDQADIVVVFARTDKQAGTRGITAFLVETSSEGYKAGKKERKMGLRGSNTVELHFDNVQVPAENVLGEVNKGFHIAMALLDTGRIGIASQAVGIAQACLDASVKYAVSASSLANPRRVRRNSGEDRRDGDAPRSGAPADPPRRVAQGQRQPYGREASMAKLFASQAANWCAKEAVQIHGGAGYTRDFPVERYFRDARVTEIYEGTTEIQRLVIARSYLRP